MDVRFWQRTNDHDVVFTMTNRSPTPVTFWIGLPQVKTNDVWPRPHITANDGALPPPSVLTAGGHTNLVVKAPMNGTEWRLPVFWQVQGGGYRLRGIISVNLRILRRWWPDRHRAAFPGVCLRGDRSVQTAYSATITK
ncbi:MAG: hypothetical protein NT154_31020 [Verrucomicrobia bacterium]|nr:hypothetical protein [Verrucomicrobiota bacterium]